MTWTILYNEFGHHPSDPDDWGALHIQDYRSEMILADDGVTHETTRHTLTGTALINRSSATLLKNAIAAASSQLSRQGKRLQIKVGGQTWVDVSGQAEDTPSDDSLETPRCDFQIREIQGSISAIVGFTFTWHKYEVLSGEEQNYAVQSHWWTQRFVMEESGLMTHFVNGALTVRASATNQPFDDANNPDAYRYFVLPDLPPGFRRKRMDFATDESGRKLIYSVENQEYPRNLPAPARLGTGSFSWRRTLESGPSALGIKVFDAELEGDASASPAQLLAQLVLVAQNRIFFAGTGADLITSIEVTEHDIFNTNRIGLHIVAQAVGNKSAPLQGTTPGFNLLQDIASDTAPYEPPNPYGAALIKAVRRAMFVPAASYTFDTFPKAETTKANNPDEENDVGEFQLPDAQFEQVQSQFDPGTEAGNIQQEHENFPYLETRVSEHVRNETNAVVMPSQSLNGLSTVHQLRKPRLIIDSIYAVARHNQQPPRFFLQPPSGTILIFEDFKVQPGPVDANNNRSYIAVYMRRLEVLDIGQSGWITQTGSIPGVGSFRLRLFIPPQGKLALPFDPITQSNTDINRTVFDTDNNFQNFNITLNWSAYTP